MSAVLCVDFGSTYTKAALVDADRCALVGTASHATTLETDILDGLDACRNSLAPLTKQYDQVSVLGCSSAGGGLLIGVVGSEELVTVEAGRRVALSSGGRVGPVSYGLVDVCLLRAAAPDVVLLVGGTDGGDAEVLLDNARALAEARWTRPVVVAGNAEATDQIAGLLTAAATPFVLADNVVPQIGVLRPEPARMAIREMFLRHVIGGKHLSSRTDFVAMVQGATPDVVLTAVELLAGGLGPDRPGVGDVVVVDIGGATTDVHSVTEIEPEDAGLSRQVVASVPVSRTVEADLGMRWSAVTTVEAAVDAHLVEIQAGLVEAEPAEGGLTRTGLRAEAARRRADPSMLPVTETDDAVDLELAAAAATIALRRHAGRQQVVFSSDGRLVERSGKDLRDVDLLVGSGGVLRHHGLDQAKAVLEAATGDHVDGGWLVPRGPRIAVDSDYVLAAAGLLAPEHPVAAYEILRTHLVP